MTANTPVATKAVESSAIKLRRRLSGDLDNIVLKALRKEPAQRYVSVEQLAEDIHRHLSGLPVSATKGSWSYSGGKFVRRHKIGMAATAIVLIAVAGGVAATIREARIADTNKRRAEQRFNDVRKLANSLIFEIHDAIRDLPGSTPARQLIVNRALEYLDSLSSQSKGDLSLQKELAAAYDRVGDVLGYPYAANLGDKDGAMKSYRKALSIREPLAALNPNDKDLQRDLSGTYFRLAHVLETTGNFNDALAALAKQQAIAERLAQGSTDPVILDHLAGGYYFTASIQAQTGDFPSALVNYQRSAKIRSAAIDANPGAFQLRTHLAADYAGIAQCHAAQKDLAQAIELQTQATAILENVLKSNAGSAGLSEFLGESVNRLAGYLRENGQFAASLDASRRSHKIFADLVAADPKDELAKSNFGFSNNGIGSALIGMGKANAAIPVFRDSIVTFEKMSPRTASNRYLRSGLAEAYSGLGDAYAAMASAKGVAASSRQQFWKEAHSAYELSLTEWKDKEKRGEMQSGEKESEERAALRVAEAQAKRGK